MRNGRGKRARICLMGCLWQLLCGDLAHAQQRASDSQPPETAVADRFHWRLEYEAVWPTLNAQYLFPRPELPGFTVSSRDGGLVSYSFKATPRRASGGFPFSDNITDLDADDRAEYIPTSTGIVIRNRESGQFGRGFATIPIDRPLAIHVHESLLFVLAGGDEVLQVFDVSDLVDPIALGSIEVCQRSGRSLQTILVNASGTRCYVAGTGAGIDVVDTSNPDILSVVGVFDPDEFLAHDLAWVAPMSRFLLVADARGFSVLDATNDEIQHVSTTSSKNSSVRIASDGHFAYLSSASGVNGGLVSFDLTNLAFPVPIDTVPSENDPNRGGSRDVITVVGGVALADGVAGVRSFDVSEDGHLMEAERLPGRTPALGIAVHGDVAYVANGYSGLRILERGAGWIEEIGGVEIDGAEVWDVTADGDRMYAAARGIGLVVLDISAPRAPRLIGIDDRCPDIYRIARTKERLLVTGQYEAYLFDTRGEQMPALADSLTRVPNRYYNASCLVDDSNRAWLGGDDGWIWRYDTQNYAFSVVDSVRVADYDIFLLEAAGEYVLQGGLARRLRFFDLATGAHAPIDSIEIGETIYSACVTGERIWVGDYRACRLLKGDRTRSIHPGDSKLLGQ